MFRKLRRTVVRLMLVQAVLMVIAQVAKQLLPSFGGEDDDEFALVAITDGARFKSHAKAFRGGTAIAGYGGLELDLRDVELAPGGADLDLTAVFGGIDVTVPTTWRVEQDGWAVLGGIMSRTTPKDELPDDAPTLRVQPRAIFGGVAVTARGPDAEEIEEPAASGAGEGT